MLLGVIMYEGLKSVLGQLYTADYGSIFHLQRFHGFEFMKLLILR